MDLPIHLGDPLPFYLECVYALAILVLGLFYIRHLPIPYFLKVLVTLLFLMDWIDTHLEEPEW